MHRRILAATFTVGLLAGSAGCTAVEQVDEEEILRGYFSDLLQTSETEQTPATEFAASGSAAHSYATELAGRIEQGHIEGLFEKSDLEVSFNFVSNQEDEEEGEQTLEDVSLCLDSSAYTEANRETLCFVFSAFEFEEGLLIDFTTEGDAIRGNTLGQYFGAHNRFQPEDRLKASLYAAPRSKAEAYAIQQSQVSQADLDGGRLDTSTGDLLVEDDILLLCYGDYKSSDVRKEDACYEYSDFVFEGDRLANFRAGTASLDGRIAIYEDVEYSIGDIGSLVVLSAYETIDGRLFITVEVTSSTEILRPKYPEPTYLAANGRPIASSGARGPSELREGRVANVSYTFAGAVIGGELEVYFSNESYNEVFLSIPIR